MSNRRHLQSEPLDLMQLLEETRDPASGALVVFSGTVRNHHAGKGVVRLEYSAHRALVEQVLAELEQEVIGDDSVLVVVRSAHRPQAFEAARYAIDTLKVRAPVWKREHYSDGSVDYQEGVPLQQADLEN